MTSEAIKLAPRAVAKPWGRTDIAPPFANFVAGGERIGEIWFELPGDGPEPLLLVKYLFTSEKLSVQVHPDDAGAQAVGARQGKEEAWVILSATPDARLGLGLTAPMDSGALRASALDGSIEAAMDWRAVAPGDHFHITPGTIHAIGGGLALVEVQQYADITYRLYDYGRPRLLHLDAAIGCATPDVYRVPNQRQPLAPGVELLVDGPKFALIDAAEGDLAVLNSAEIRCPADAPRWFIPLSGAGTIDGQPWVAGECWLLNAPSAIAGTGRALMAWPGGLA